MPKLADRVKETTTTTGTGAISLGGAAVGYRAFSAAFATGDTVYYCIEGGAEWEVGIGTLTSGSPWTLARTSILASSNAGAAVSFSAGDKSVFCTASAVSFPLTAPSIATLGDIGSQSAGTAEAWFSNGGNLARFIAVVSETYGAGQMAANPLAMTAIANSITAMGVVVESSTAMDAIFNASAAMVAVEAVLAAVVAIAAKSETLLGACQSLYADLSKWVGYFNWTARTLPSSSNWQSVTYGNGVFVAVSSTAGMIAATSPDGITWTARTLPTSATWYSVTYGNGRFVATASGPTTAAATSPNGITWTTRTLPSSRNWISVAYGKGLFITIASSLTYAATSPDGITWTARTLPSSSSWKAVGYGNGIFVAVAANGAAAMSTL